MVRIPLSSPEMFPDRLGEPASQPAQLLGGVLADRADVVLPLRHVRVERGIHLLEEVEHPDEHARDRDARVVAEVGQEEEEIRADRADRGEVRILVHDRGEITNVVAVPRRVDAFALDGRVTARETRCGMPHRADVDVWAGI